MTIRQVRFGEFQVPLPRGHQRITDRDETTEYLFINAPRNIYTVYFDSGMPLYSESILSGATEGSTLELKLTDRRIVFFCPSGGSDRGDGLWYFNIEFAEESGKIPILSGQIMVNSDEVYRRTVGGKLPFLEILEKIRLSLDTAQAV